MKITNVNGSNKEFSFFLWRSWGGAGVRGELGSNLEL